MIMNALHAGSRSKQVRLASSDLLHMHLVLAGMRFIYHCYCRDAQIQEKKHMLQEEEQQESALDLQIDMDGIWA